MDEKCSLFDENQVETRQSDTLLEKDMTNVETLKEMLFVGIILIIALLHQQPCYDNQVSVIIQRTSDSTSIT